MDLHLTRSGPVVPVLADPLGLAGPTPGQARGARWRTSSPGRFVPVGVRADDTQQRIVEAVAGGVAGTAATGWSALHWQGSRWFSGRRADGTPEPVLLAVGDSGNLAPLAVKWLAPDDFSLVRTPTNLVLRASERHASAGAASPASRASRDATNVSEFAL